MARPRPYAGRSRGARRRHQSCSARQRSRPKPIKWSARCTIAPSSASREASLVTPATMNGAAPARRPGRHAARARRSAAIVRHPGHARHSRRSRRGACRTTSAASSASNIEPLKALLWTPPRRRNCPLPRAEKRRSLLGLGHADEPAGGAVAARPHRHPRRRQRRCRAHRRNALRGRGRDRARRHRAAMVASLRAELQGRPSGYVDAQGHSRRGARTAHGNGSFGRFGLEPPARGDPRRHFGHAESRNRNHAGPRAAPAAAASGEGDRAGFACSMPIDVDEAETRVEFVGACRIYASELALNEVDVAGPFGVAAISGNRHQVLLDLLRHAGDADRPFRQSQVDAAIRFCRIVFGAEYAGLLAKAAEVAGACRATERKAGAGLDANLARRALCLRRRQCAIAAPGSHCGRIRAVM